MPSPHPPTFFLSSGSSSPLKILFFLHHPTKRLYVM